MNLGGKTQEVVFLVFVILIGALAAFGVLAFRALISLGQWGLWPGGDNFLEQVRQAPWWLKLLLPALGGLAIGPVIAYWAPEVRGPGVPEVMEAVALREGYIPPRVTFFKPLCTALIISVGGSVGREGPVVQIGAAIGSALSRFFNFTSDQIRICLACGAAAGIAATFNAPFAGTLFAVEIILADIQIAYLGHIVLAAVLATVISRWLMGDFPVFTIFTFEFKHPGELWLYLLLGVLAGLLSILFIKAIFGTDTLFGKLPFPEWLKPMLGGLLLGLIGLASPNVFGVGYESINLALAGKTALVLTLGLLLAKFLATALCLGSGMSGGIFAPSLFLGAMLGTTLALAINFLVPGLQLQPADYALVGMGAMVCGTTLGPITAVLTIFELTNTYRIILPLMASCIASLLTVKYLYGYSLYETKLLRRGVNLVRGHEVNILRSLLVKDYMTTRMEVLYDHHTLHEILQKAEASPYPFFIVLNEAGELGGVLTLWDLRKVLEFTEDLSNLVVAQELKTEEVITVTPEDNFETALNLLEANDISFLPVVLPPERKKVVGVLRIEDLLAVYNQRVLKHQMLRPFRAGSADRGAPGAPKPGRHPEN